MKLTEVKNPPPRRGYKSTKLFSLLQEFAQSGMMCARVGEWDQKDARIFRNNLNASIKRFHLENISVRVRDGEVYLINEVLYESGRN